MATPKFSSHARSISLPSSSHPLLVTVEAHIQRLKSSEVASSTSQLLACQKLDGLKNLYECLDDVLQLPLSQQALSNEDVLDGSLMLLDICGAVRDIYSQMKETVQELESSLRRKRNGDLANEVSSYMISRKHLNKMISKCYKDLKKAAKNCNLEAVNKEAEKLPLVNLIKEVQEVSLSILESTLSLVSPFKAGSQPKGWSLVSKLLQHRTPSSEGHSNSAAMERIEIELHLINKNKSNKDVVKELEALDSSIQELAEMLEIVFRLLLKTRVSLLNILNH
ncbi:uncharacterized protein LOC113766457 [Coffea eugenioides]|uniref:uncharacterized protein LOC113766457 n=1 Tax=Coffea eugenioides TaxID=49369 RepID=UPI000F60A18B|nr:uncharacterized protein LOC113766457 [Coffea eugenioides]